MLWSGAIIAWGQAVPDARPSCYRAEKPREDPKIGEVFMDEAWPGWVPKMGRKVHVILHLEYYPVAVCSTVGFDRVAE